MCQRNGDSTTSANAPMKKKTTTRPCHLSDSTPPTRRCCPASPASSSTAGRRRRRSSSMRLFLHVHVLAALLASVISSSASAAAVVVDGKVDDRRGGGAPPGRMQQHANVRGGGGRRRRRGTSVITSTGGKDRGGVRRRGSAGSSQRRRQLDRGEPMLGRTPTSYRILTSEEIYARLTELASAHPDLCTLTSSQDMYGLPTADNCNSESCKNWILTIEDMTAHPVNSTSHSVLPEVLLSGCLHGNERVGPTATVEAASLLLEAAECEAKLHSISTRDVDPCVSSLSSRGVESHGRRWLARLVSTRRIVVLPTANALGYMQGVREENGIDPNRDFPYDQEDYSRCMQTIAGRTVNELFRNHMFQLSLTYHAGMEAIGYEWGNPTPFKDENRKSPDDLAQNELAGGYSRFAGLASGAESGVYPYGPTNDLVYPVNGGMEDWAYAATFEDSLTRPCEPSSYGGYDPSKTTYEDGMLRTFNMLIETSDDKEPDGEYLGTDEDVLGGSAGNGHVTRNVRLAINAIEMVEPYVRILGVGDDVIGTDVVPGTPIVSGDCHTTDDHIAVSTDVDTVDVDWTVGGAFTVDETGVIAVKLVDLPHGIFDCTSQLKQSDLDAFASSSQSLIQSPNPHTGRTHWHSDGAHPTSSNPEYPPDVAVFTQPINVSTFVEGDEIAVIALAKVDNEWTKQPSNIRPSIPPQSHVVNARTNPDWSYEITDVKGNHKRVQGRDVWMSRVVTIKMSPRTLQGSSGGAITNADPSSPGGCEDVTSFEYKDETRTCEWVKNSYTRCKLFGEERCPKTCNLC